MSSSLADGFIAVVRRIGHRDHRTSVPLDIHIWGYMKNMVHERKVYRGEVLHLQIFNVARRKNYPDVLRFKSSSISNIRRYVTVDNLTYVHATYLTGNNVRN
jgi:hypothetical protein